MSRWSSRPACEIQQPVLQRRRSASPASSHRRRRSSTGCPPTEALGPALLGSAVRHWIGYLDGTAAAAAASHAAHGVVNVCLVATLPAARRRGAWRTLVVARCADTQDLPAVAFTSDYSRPGFLRTGFLPITRFTLWAVVA
jgi:hypothetical protein